MTKEIAGAMVDISELEKRRFKFLKGVYDASEGVAGRTLNAAALQEALGFDGAEAWKIMLYLTKQGLTKVGNGWVEITHQGMLEVEAAHRRPDQPTEHFESEAFRSVVNVYGPVGALMTGAGATASVVQNLSGTDRAEILKALEA